MRLWSLPEGTVSSNRSRSNWLARPILAAGLSMLLFALTTTVSPSFAESSAAVIPSQQSKKASPYVGSAMAVLATLEQAGVLPPEGTKEADGVIKSVIQFQSAFSKSADASIQRFLRDTVNGKYGEKTAAVLERFHSTGWTSEVLEALADADQRDPAAEMERLATGFGQFNLSVDDFKRLMQLVRDGRSALAARGQHFEEVYAHHRTAMPGAAGR